TELAEEALKRGQQCSGQFLTLRLPFESQIVSRPIHRQQLHFGRNQLDRRFHLLDRSEWITPPVDEQGRCLQFGEMLRAQLSWLARRMKWIGEQNWTIDQPRLTGSGHR